MVLLQSTEQGPVHEKSPFIVEEKLLDVEKGISHMHYIPDYYGKSPTMEGNLTLHQNPG